MEPPRSQPAPRTWSLSAWPVRAKVAAVVALPLALAMSFGALRIQAELAIAAQLSAAAENARIVSPALALDELIGTAALGGVAVPDDTLDAAVDAVRDAIAADDIDETSTFRFDRTADAARTMNRELAAGSVPASDRATISTDITSAVSAVLVDALSVDSAAPRVTMGAVVDAMSGRRSAQTQQLLVSVPDVTMIDRVNRAAGVESADIDSLESALGPDSAEIGELRAQLDLRLGMYAAAASGGPTAAFLSAGQSTALYSSVAQRFSGDLIETLSGEALDRRSVALRDTALVLGSVLTALVLALVVARSLLQPIRRLRLGALAVAHKALPAEIEQIRSGGHTPEIQPVPVHTSEEIGQLARAVDAIHEEALRLAGEQARLRVQVGNMFETLSRRSRSLVDQQLALIEELERDEDDPRRLDSLFRLDHLATRMRRNGANLMVLAGTRSRRSQSDQPVALDTVMSAAISEVEDYRRVLMLDVPDTSLTAAAAADVVHIVAELIDNALRYSPPDSAVAVTAARAIEGGILLEVADRGLGMPAADMDETNERLSAGGEVTPETARRMGLFVVGRLAQRHGVTVRLRATQVQGGTTGVTVSVHIPVELVVTAFPTTEPTQPSRRERAVEARATSARALPESPLERTAPLERTGPLDRSGLLGRTAPVSRGVTEGHAATSSRLPRRRPGASGVDDHIASTNGTAEPVLERTSDASPSDTSAFFGARPAVRTHRGSDEPTRISAPSAPPDPLAPPQTAPIYQRMVSEWLVDPATGQGRTRSWSSHADDGWAAAESATVEPVRRRTESGLPVRTPGARLVPGAVDSSAAPTTERPTATAVSPARSPDEVRHRLTSHFTGVRTGRAEDVTGRHRTEDNE